MPIDLGHEFGQAFMARGDGLQNRWLPSAAHSEIDHVPDLAHGAVSAITIGLVNNEDVTDLENAGLGGLDTVTHAWRQQHQRGIGGCGNLDLRLPDAHGFDDRDIEASRIENAQYLRGRSREAAEMAT